MGANVREAITSTRERVVRPTDVEFVDKLSQAGIRRIVSVPCSITAGIQNIWELRAKSGELDLINTTNEHNLVGLAAGAYLGTGETTLIHMQNSGLPNAGDGFISFAAVYSIPTLALVTWRGNTGKDDSEPHQEIGKRTEKLTEVIVGDDVFGTRMGRGILRAVDKAVDVVEKGGVAVIRLSPEAFDPTHKPTLPQESEVYSWKDILEKRERDRAVAAEKGTEFSPIPFEQQMTRDEALREIKSYATSPSDTVAILFSNGYTARAAQATVDRLGNFYNAGYMGGTLAIGYGLARSNPNIRVIVVDGDQNAQMSNMKDHLTDYYPPNLEWFILNNGIGASVGTARSLPLASWYFDLARVIQTVPDEYGSFKHPRVRGVGAYSPYNADDAREMAERIGPLPFHTLRFREWVAQRTNDAVVAKFMPTAPVL